MRGALVTGANRNHRIGIIPADAGSTPSSSSATYDAEDHPRGCGEHLS